MTKLLLALIRLYQLLLSPLLGNVCRFEPSCSRYAAACIATHGPARGSWLALKRIGRCHPFHAGGYDPPPPNVRAAKPSPARPESSCHTECRAHGCSR
ncbi:MAG TPA: membrane protein insertion efficiency factor YidD [Polyangiales bacterium]